MSNPPVPAADSRTERIRQIVRMRMAGLSVLLESIYDPANRAAVMRTAEAFGLTSVHLVDRDAAQKHRARKVSRSAERWLQICDHTDSTTALTSLRAQGFRIYAADPRGETVLHDLPFDLPTILAFGNEHRGLSSELLDGADVRFRIPMRGFVESLNLSTAAAVAIAVARSRREAAIGALSDLTETEQAALVTTLNGHSERNQND